VRQSALLIIFLVVFLDLVGFGIVIPILPYYAQQYGASAWQLGWLMTSYSLVQFLFAPVWGRISDYVGRRPVLLVSILGTSFSMAILGLAGSLEWLFIGRILAGIAGANISTAYAYVADVTTEEDRAKGMGLIGAGFGLGFIFGPAIGGVLSRWGFGVPMFVASLLALANFAFAFFKLQEPVLPPDVRSAHRFKRFDLEGIRLALEDGRTRFAVGTFLLVTFAVTQMEVTFALFMGARYGFDAERAGVLLAAMGVVMVAVQGGLISRLVRRFGEVRLVILGAAVCAAALTVFASTNSVELVVVSLLFLAFGHGMLHPSLSSLASLGAPVDQRGAAMGVFQSAGSLARVLGPPCAGWLYDRMSWRSPFYSGSILLALASLIAIVWLKSATPEKDETAT
jgi:DHA1 family tetracycline resistance protein-like MFS transporter